MKKNITYQLLSFVIEVSMPVYGGEKDTIKIIKDKMISKGNSCNTTTVSLSTHAGTHVDFPKHFYNKGKSEDKYPVNYWIANKVIVINLKNIKPGSAISENIFDGKSIDKNVDCILIKTHFNKYRKHPVYWQNSPYISYKCAKLLRKFRNLKFIGVDFISISNINNREEGRNVHKELLSNKKRKPVLIIEDMNLSPLKKEIKRLFIVPLRIKNTDGAPCSIIAEIKY